jgi:tetratricopeptide (TPR) repeat protein
MSPDDVQKEIEQLEQRFAENSKGLVFAHLADAYRKAGEYGKAEGLILHGLKNHPNYISAYNVLGRVYLDSERFGEAHQQFSRVLELDPHNLIALRALGDLAARDGEIAAARSWYERMLQVDPRNEEAREVLQKLESDAIATEGASGGEFGPAETAAEPIAAESQGGDTGGEDVAESAELQIVDSPGLESAAPPETAAPEVTPTEEGWGIGETDVVARQLEDQDDTFEPVEGLLSESEQSSFDEGEVGEAAPGWEDLDEIETADRPASYLSEVTEEAAADEAGSPPAEGARPMQREGSEWELGEMDAWTPGLLAEEELGGAADIENIDDHFDLNVLDEDEPGFGGAEDAGDTSDERRGGEGVVTETMAELYAQQGLHHDALKIYEQLLEVRPNDERIRARVNELRGRLDVESPAASDDDEFEALLQLTESGGTGGDWSGTDSVLEEGERDAVGAEPSEPGEPAPGGMEETRGIAELEAEDVLREALQSAAPASHPPEGDDFEFEDEAPVAGIEHLDPFAASFNVFAKQEGPGREAAPLLPRAEKVAPIEEVRVELGSAPELEPVSEVSETVEAGAAESEAEVAEWEATPVGESEPESPEPWIRGLAPEEEDTEEVARPAAELEPERAESAGPPDGALVAEGYSDEWEAERAAPEPQPEAKAPRTEELEVSIEEYLAGLLSYEVGSRSASVGEEPAETAAAGSEGSLAAEGAGQGGESGAGGEGRKGAEGAEGGEDLEEFQEWLRSLKR